MFRPSPATSCWLLSHTEISCAQSGQVKSLDLSVVTFLETGNREVVAQNYCQAEARNGFLTFRYMASEDQGGEVDVLISIAPLHFTVPLHGVLP